MVMSNPDPECEICRDASERYWIVSKAFCDALPEQKLIAVEGVYVAANILRELLRIASGDRKTESVEILQTVLGQLCCETEHVIKQIIHDPEFKRDDASNQD